MGLTCHAMCRGRSRCRTEYMRAWYDDNRERVLERHRTTKYPPSDPLRRRLLAEISQNNRRNRRDEEVLNAGTKT